MEYLSLKTTMVLGLLFSLVLKNTNGKFTECSRTKFSNQRQKNFINNVELVHNELKEKVPSDSNFEQETKSVSGARVFGRESCFSTLTTSVGTCTKCLEKVIKAIKKECINSI